MRTRMKKLEGESEENKEDMKASNNLHSTTIRTTVLPMISGVIYKAVYDTGMEREPLRRRRQDPRVSSVLRRNQARFAQFGMKSKREMKIFADTVPVPPIP